MSTLTKSSPLPISKAPAEGAQTLRFIGRQPILDVRQRTFGQEVLFRCGTENAFSGTADAATRQVIDNLLMLGPQSLVPTGKVFVNCTNDALINGLVTLLPPETTVIEILETVAVDDEVVRVCEELKESGYAIALDDYTPTVAMDRLLPSADYVKLDFRACDAASLASICAHLHGRGVDLIAEKVESQIEFEAALEGGFKYFQGYFFARPTILQSREIAPNKVLYLQLLAAISFSPFDRPQVERLVMAEASLCYRLLRLVNSVGMGIRNPVKTVRQAMLMIGDDELRKLITVAGAMMLGSSMKLSDELILMALYRARFCELLAATAGQIGGEQYLIGMLSVMDAMLLMPLDEVVAMLPLRSEAAAALLGADGPASVPIRLLKAYENKEWKTCRALCSPMRITEERLAELYVAALRWASNQIRESSF